MSVGPNKKPDSEANNDNNNNQVPPETTNGTKTNGETSNKQNGTSSDSMKDAADTEATPKPRISRTKRRRRGPRPSHRKWEEEIMPEGNLTGLFNSDISDQEEEASEEEEKPKGSEEWATAKVPDEDLESLTDDSPSRLEWLRQKKDEGQTNEHLDSVMSMVGLEAIKAHFLDVKQRVEAAKRWSEDLKSLKLDLIMAGKDGTGKKRIAQLYAEFLFSIGAVSRRDFFKVSDDTSLDLEKTDGAAVLFFETGDKLNRDYKMDDVLKYKDNIDGGAVLILSFREIGTDEKNQLEETPESRRRLPEPIKIEDYTAEETSEVIRRLIKHKTEFTDETPTDIIVKILTARVMRKRTQDEDEFTNVACMSDELDKVCERYVKRVDSEWAEWSKKNSPAEGTDIEEQKPKKGGVTVDDVLGPQAPSVRSTSKAWKEIQELVGLHQVKKEIGYLFDLAEFNQEREREGKDATPMALNRCFFGNPGVGKTTVVGLYGKILSELGLLSQGHVITKTPDDLIGKWIGHTEARTLEALDEAKGGILIIDDAHMLYNGSGRGGCSDVFRIAAIDTLVANISGSPGEDRCVILSGYEDQMDQMFLNSNPGLQRRFPLENALRFANYTEDELCQILELKMKAEGLSASEDGLKVAREVLGRMRSRPMFGNGGDVVSFLARTKLRQIDRLKSAGLSIFDLSGSPLEPRDFDPDFDRALRADENRAAIFNGMVGFEDIVEQFKRYQKMTDGMRRHDIDPRPHIPWAFVFKGPPGTGKTSTARKIGRLFYDMGFLSSDDVHTCSVTDIIGQFVGQTGPKVINQFELGLGRVLFIDEAYRLAGGSSCDSKFAADAIGEIVDAMTKPRYMGNMVVILAGYGDEMEKLLQTNPGLRSRFPTHIEFKNMKGDHCLQHLSQTLAKTGIKVQQSLVDGPHNASRENILATFMQLGLTKGWANGRDVETLAKRLIGHVFVRAGEAHGESDAGELTVSYEDLQRFCNEMLVERGGSVRPPARNGNDLLGVKGRLGPMSLNKTTPLTNGYKAF